MLIRGVQQLCSCCRRAVVTPTPVHNEQQEAFPVVNATKRRERPCLCDDLLLDESWACLSEQEVVSRVILALRAWAAQLDTAPEDILQLESDLSCSLNPCVFDHGCEVDSCLLRFCAVATLACDDAMLAKDLSHQLSTITRSMIRWAFPEHLKTKQKTGLAFDRLLQVVGGVRMLLHTRWQALQGRSRQSWARKRLQCVHPCLTEVLFRRGPLSMSGRQCCVHFFGLQLRCAKIQPQGQGLLYLLCSQRQCYLGSTSCDRSTWRCTMKVAMPRFYEHLHDIKSAKQCTYNAKHVRKARLFRWHNLGDLCLWVVCVADLSVARALEQCFLRVGCWPANSQGTQGTVCNPRRRSQASRRIGRRPPSRFRHRPYAQHPLLQHVDHVLALASRLPRVQQQTVGLRMDAEYLQRAFRLPFHDAYWHVFRHKFARDGMLGPLDLRAVNCQVLLARYACDATTACWESLRQRWVLQSDSPGCEAIVAINALRRQSSSNARARGLRHCDRWLRAHGLPGTRKYRVQWQELVPRRVFRSCVRAVERQLLQTCSPLLATWLAGTAQAVLQPRAKYTRHWNHIRVCRDQCSAEWFDMCTADLAITPEEGAAMQLCKFYWKTPVWEPLSRIAKRAESMLYSWVRSMPVTVNSSWKCCIRGWLKDQLGHTSPHGFGLEKHKAYVAQLVVPPGFVAAQEDKDQSSCWIMPNAVYCKLFALMVNQDERHWVPIVVPVASMVERYRQQHADKLPAYMQRYCCHHLWKKWQLPYMYVNIKTKCFASGLGRICSKHNHACCRRVVSWAAHPCRKLYKMNARALEAVVRLWGEGFETSTLFTAVRDFSVAVSKLKHDHGFCSTCYRCKKEKPSLSLWVGDAAQLFEEIDQSEVMARLRDLLRELEVRTGGYGVVTKKNRKLHCWVARNNFRPSQGACLHRWSEIACVSELALAQTAVRVGPTVYEQCRGVPIGMFLSKQFASVFLGHAESEWVKQTSVEAATEWKPAGLGFSQAVAATRYVDDLALASSVLCTACLGDLTKAVYAAPVSFDQTKPTNAGLPWLDVWLRVTGLNLEVHAHANEQAWRDLARVGDLQFPTKFRMMPFQGHEMLDMPMLTALLCGRLKRLKSLDLSVPNMKRAVDCDLQIWVLHGYPLDVVQKIWRKGRHYPEAVSYARESLMRAMHCCGPSASIVMPWEACHVG